MISNVGTKLGLKTLHAGVVFSADDRQLGRAWRSGSEEPMGGSLPDSVHAKTPDGRYFMVRGRLWRCTNPSLPPDEKARLTKQLMDARRQIAFIKRDGSGAAELMTARKAVDRAKTALGERGPVWWDDGAPDYNRRMARNTPYRDWAAERSE